MSTKKAATTNVSAESKQTRHQKFAIEEVSRTAITGAPYNPRQIDAHAAKKLRENIGKVGLLLPIIVNRRTGRVVSGHQRLTQLDTLEKGTDYKLKVAYVELTDKQEKEQNLFMNNSSAQGSWDTDMLSQMMKTGIDYTLAGFEASDLSMMLDDWTPTAVEKKATSGGVEEDEVEAAAAKIAELKAARKKGKEKYAIENDQEYNLIIVFRDRAHCDGFLKSLKIDADTKVLSPDRLTAAIEDRLSKTKKGR
jgi:hypothetical protein